MIEKLPCSRESTELVIFTIGHSTHPIDRFIEMPEASKVERLVDIRTIPRSRHNPQFEGEALSRSLWERQIDYVYLPQLGGLRRTSEARPIWGWGGATPHFEATPTTCKLGSSLKGLSN